MKHRLRTPFRRLASVATGIVLTVAAVTAIVSSAAGPAQAVMPNESGSYSPEMLGDGSRLQAYGTVSEARSSTATVRMWRGLNNYTIWASFNGGAPYIVQNGTSPSEPTVVPHGSGFAAFHTGTNGRIYFTRGNGTANGWQPWQQLPYGTVVGSIGATQVGTRASLSTSIYIGYRGSGGSQLFGAYFDGNNWGNEQRMGAGQSYSPPGLAWDQRTSRIRAVIRGQSDNRIYVATQDYGSSTWSGWGLLGNNYYVLDTPSIAIDDRGYVMIAAVSPIGEIVYVRGDPSQGWLNSSVDSTGWRTNFAVSLVIIGTIFYTVMTGTDEVAYFKQNFSY